MAKINITDEAIKNAIKAYKNSDEPLAKVTVACLKELLKYRELGTVKELDKALMDLYG